VKLSATTGAKACQKAFFLFVIRLKEAHMIISNSTVIRLKGRIGEGKEAEAYFPMDFKGERVVFHAQLTQGSLGLGYPPVMFMIECALLRLKEEVPFASLFEDQVMDIGKHFRVTFMNVGYKNIPYLWFCIHKIGD
jgi:hypothetical protein